jgi:hypothetical protein
MRASEFIIEAKVSIRDQILADVKQHGGSLDDYFVRMTDHDGLGYSARQQFGKSPDMDHPKFDVEYIGQQEGRPALWFYPLEFWLKGSSAYAAEKPYTWLVKLKPNAWLQDARRGDRGIKPAPPGKERVGIMRHSWTPAAIFFKPGWQVVGKYYDYGGQHQRHGEVKGPEAASPPSFFDRIRGYDESQ